MKSMKWKTAGTASSLKPPYTGLTRLGGGVRERAKLLQYWPLSSLKIWTLYDGYKLKKWWFFKNQLKMQENADN